MTRHGLQLAILATAALAVAGCQRRASLTSEPAAPAEAPTTSTGRTPDDSPAAQRAQATTGSEGLVGAEGIVRQRLAPEGLVVVWGETWRATSESGEIDQGAAVEVTAVDGLRVRVRAVGPDAPAASSELTET